MNVLRLFRSNIKHRREVGAGLCVIDDGKVVVDLWGGVIQQDTRKRWCSRTVCPIFSATKGIIAFCFLMLHDRRLLDYDVDVQSYWPEFPVENVSVRTLLDHRSGLIALDEDPRIEDLRCENFVGDLLARQRPVWSPGSKQGYHGVTWGLYAAELFRRVAGTSVGRFLDSEIASPLGLQMWIGVPKSRRPKVASILPVGSREFVLHLAPRCLTRSEEGRVLRSYFFDGNGPTRLAFRYPSALGTRGLENFNSPHVQQTEIGWAGGICGARDLAVLYQALACDGMIGPTRILSARSAQLPSSQKRLVRDEVLKRRMTWNLGFTKEHSKIFSTSDRAFGHVGAGGAMGWCDPKIRRSIAYIPNRMDYRIRSRRAIELCKAIASVSVPDRSSHSAICPTSGTPN